MPQSVGAQLCAGLVPTAKQSTRIARDAEMIAVLI